MRDIGDMMTYNHRLWMITAVVLLFIPFTLADDNIVITPASYKNTTRAGDILEFNIYIINKDEVPHTLLFLSDSDGVSFTEDNKTVDPTTLYVTNKVHIIVPNSSLYGTKQSFKIIVVDTETNHVYNITGELALMPDLTGSPLKLFIGVTYLDFTEFSSDAIPVPIPNIILPLILIVGMMLLGRKIKMKKRWWILLLPLILFISGLMILVLQRLWFIR